jgi:hypothetical protein
MSSGAARPLDQAQEVGPPPRPDRQPPLADWEGLWLPSQVLNLVQLRLVPGNQSVSSP